MPTILAFGDSITRGTGISRNGGWANLLRQYLDMENVENNKLFYDVYNLGIGGETSKSLLERIGDESKRRIWGKTATLIAVGINDSAWVIDKKRNWVSREEYGRNLKKIIKKAENFSHKIILIGPNPIDETKTSPASFDETLNYFEKDLKRYNNIMKNIASDNSILFINLIDQLDDFEDCTIDGLHPNDKGHEKMFEVIRKELIKEKII